MAATPWVLAADVGGTNCRLALYGDGGPERQDTLPTDARSFLVGVQAFLRETPIAGACVAVAGPVQDGCARLTNHHWTFDAGALTAALGAPVAVINDFAAATRGIATLGPGDSHRLSGPAPLHGGVVALGPGTGLGLGWMVPAGDDWHVAPTEGGHQDFAPHDAWEAELWARLHARHGHVSWERVLSGPGLVTLHDHAVFTGLAGLAAPSPALVASGPEPACVVARDRFARLLGHFAGDCALGHLPAGGVWLCGGVPPRLSTPGFDAAVVQGFLDKGRFSGLLEGIPLSLVTADDLGLRGAAATARGRLTPQ